MRSYDENAFDDADAPDRDTEKGPRLPGGITVQTAAAALLIVAVVVVLWLLASPEAEAPADLATETPVAAESRPMTGTLAAGRVTGGTPVSGAALGTAGAMTAAAPAVATVAGTVPGLATPLPGVSTPTLAVEPATGNLAEGTFAQIAGSGAFGVRLRFGPGLNYATIRIATDDEVVLVLGGPESADGYQWWRLQDTLGNVGWAADEFLSPVAAPASWSPPAASPTFEAGAGDEATAEAPVVSP